MLSGFELHPRWVPLFRVDGLKRYVNDDRFRVDGYKNMRLLAFAFTMVFVWTGPKSCKYNFRNQNFDIPSFNSVLYGKHSLRYLGPFLWNKLDKNISETRSLSRIKFRIRCKDLTELINGNNCSACVPRKLCPCY